MDLHCMESRISALLLDVNSLSRSSGAHARINVLRNALYNALRNGLQGPDPPHDHHDDQTLGLDLVTMKL